MIPSHPVHFFEFFDVITLGALVGIITWLMLTHRRKHGALLSTISQTVAVSPKSSLLFSISMTILYPVYYAFIWLWVGPSAGMPATLYYLLLISGIFEMIFVWVPATRGKNVRIHGAAVTVVVIAMFVLALMLLFAGQDLSGAAQVGLLVFLISPLVLAAFLKLQKGRKSTFLAETIISVLFLAAISITAHTYV
jgi:hypothetical protein